MSEPSDRGPKQPPVFMLALNKREVEIVGAALVELPYKMSAQLIDNINTQLAKQQQALLPGGEKKEEDKKELTDKKK